MTKHKSRWVLVGMMWLALSALAICLLTISTGQLAVGASGETLYIQTDTAVVRATPSEGAEVLLSLSKGDKVLEFRRQGDWVKVSVFGLIGKEGWVREEYLSQKPPGTAPSGSTEQTPEVDPAHQKKDEVVRPKLARFVLDIERPIGREIRAICKIVIGEKEKETERKGRSPTRLGYSAQAISCVVRRAPGLPKSNFDVSLSKEGKRIASFEGSAASVRLRSRGPWGERDVDQSGSRLLSP